MWSRAALDWSPGLGGEVELAVAVGLDVEELAVDEVMTADAEPDHVVEIGVASARPPRDVVDLQVGVVATRCGALAALLRDDRTTLLPVGVTLGAADVQDPCLLQLAAGGDDGSEVGQAAQVVEQLGADGSEPGEPGRRAMGVDDD